MTLGKTRFVVRGARLVTLYRDDIVPLLQAMGGSLQYRRASHIDPSPDGRHFQIVWCQPEIIEAVGEAITSTDDNGMPFVTKGEAESHEVKMLQKFYFKTKEGFGHEDIASSETGKSVPSSGCSSEEGGSA